MKTYNIAQVHMEGNDLLLISLQAAFADLSPAEQSEFAHCLQRRTAAAGLPGDAIPVWNSGGGRLGFFAPECYKILLQSIDLAFVRSHYSGRLNCIPGGISFYEPSKKIGARSLTQLSGIYN